MAPLSSHPRAPAATRPAASPEVEGQSVNRSVAYAAWGYALARTPAANAATFLYLIPGLTIVIAWAWLSEAPTVLSLGGGALALAGVAIVNRRDPSRPTAR